ncbi:AraC family transcriptional regulator [Atlantibacter hermannii]|uniref:AraC family transcriptional regulator n=1 Tax=Atlantibacter hermannii TaxID=565 RepID=UPI0020746F66|nr:AraC family transcriptional regulator [Atlantibacter hermannii]
MKDATLTLPCSLHASPKKVFSVSDFQGFGERYGIDYRFPQLTSPHSADAPVLKGDVEEIALAPGVSLTHSDVEVLQPYETCSRHSSPLYTLVVLEGSVALKLNDQEYVVSAGMAFTSRLSEQQAMSARHAAECRLTTLSLGVYPGNAWRQGLLDSLLREWEVRGASTFVWPVPGFLLAGLAHARQSRADGVSRQLMLEGLMLQLLGHGLNACVENVQPRCTPVRCEQHRLERVRRMIEASPEREYTLAQLAAQAAMSPSSLRSKFRQAYGCTVFDYLRDCRLELARRYLLEGHSVQHAAWVSGYQHATNFSTAFRRRYGVSPGHIRPGS